MTLSIATPITGEPQTGMAAPSFTVAADATGINSKRWVVTGVSDAGSVAVHTPSSPFYIEFFRPAVFKPAVALNASGYPMSQKAPINEYKLIVRKGCSPVSGLLAFVEIETKVRIPAGTEVNDAATIRAALSLVGGTYDEDGDGIGDWLVNGVF